MIVIVVLGGLAFLYWVLDGEGSDCCMMIVIMLGVLIAALAI